ncbi:uncharacterized protein LOC120413008 [Culex pipiens pallens]|uniref:uncharacterized protein LOC120413008 n=1 Tax=Culex pipiens pallens TaxID=42434 RepID=UPI001953534B|nr:uncharacterized protein LOC120413008 [Culex pipiens pallens]
MHPAIEQTELDRKYPFLTREYLEDALGEAAQNCTVVNFTVRRALSKGENFASDILRIQLNLRCENGDERTKTFIMKVALVTEGMSDMLEEYDVFFREIVFYSKILPEIKEISKELEYNGKLAPDCYKISAKHPQHFIFEDLSLNGFVAADRRLGLNFTQLELILEKVAKFHAISAHLYDKDPELMKYHHYRNINEDVQHFYGLFRNSMLNCAEMALKWPTTAPRIAMKLFKLEQSVIAKGCQVYTLNKADFNVLNHGDLWVNNVMYRYNAKGVPIEAMLVDFAISYFGSPAIDLSFLLFTSSADDVTEEQFDLLLQSYHQSLLGTLNQLGYSQKLPTLLDIQEDMLRKGFIGVMYSTFLLPLRVIEDTASADLGNLLGSNEEAVQFRGSLYQNPHYQRRMEYLLNYFDRKGYLD